MTQAWRSLSTGVSARRVRDTSDTASGACKQHAELACSRMLVCMIITCMHLFAQVLGTELDTS